MALAAIYDAGTRSEAARLDRVILQTVRDWVTRFNSEGPDGLRDRKAPGPTPWLTIMHRQALAAQINHGPIHPVHGVVRWRLCGLIQWPRDQKIQQIDRFKEAARQPKPDESETGFDEKLGKLASQRLHSPKSDDEKRLTLIVD